MNVLFLCTGNSARSILAEFYLAHAGKGAWHGFSAGSFPKGQVHPLSRVTLARAGIDAAGARSKSWDEFAVAGAPVMDLVITVCDNAAGEVCPIWPGHPARVHWSFPDPAAATGSEAAQLEVFAAIFARIRAAIDVLVAAQPDLSGEALLAHARAAGPQ